MALLNWQSVRHAVELGKSARLFVLADSVPSQKHFSLTNGSGFGDIEEAEIHRNRVTSAVPCASRVGETDAWREGLISAYLLDMQPWCLRARRDYSPVRSCVSSETQRRYKESVGEKLIMYNNTTNPMTPSVIASDISSDSTAGRFSPCDSSDYRRSRVCILPAPVAQLANGHDDKGVKSTVAVIQAATNSGLLARKARKVAAICRAKTARYGKTLVNRALQSSGLLSRRCGFEPHRAYSNGLWCD